MNPSARRRCSECVSASSGCGFCFSAANATTWCGSLVESPSQCVGDGTHWAVGWCPSAYSWVAVTALVLYLVCFSPGKPLVSRQARRWSQS